MSLDYSLAKAEPHHCKPPAIRTWDENATAEGRDVFATVREIPVGTRHFCPCGKVLVVVEVPEMHGRYVHVVAHREWQPETWRQRRQRARKMRHARREWRKSCARH